MPARPRRSDQRPKPRHPSCHSSCRPPRPAGSAPAQPGRTRLRLGAALISPLPLLLNLSLNPWLSLSLSLPLSLALPLLLAASPSVAAELAKPVAPALPSQPAQATSPAAASLKLAWEAAWARQPAAWAEPQRLAQAQARAEQAQGLTPQPPSLSLSQLNDLLNQRDQRKGRQEWELELSAPLWLPGQQARHTQEAEQARAEQSARLALARWQLAGELRLAWWALAAARGAEQLALERQHTAQALAQNLQRRLARGEVSRLDNNLAQTEQLAAAAEALESQQARLQTEQSLQQLTGQAPPAELAPEPMAFSPTLASLATTPPNATNATNATISPLAPLAPLTTALPAEPLSAELPADLATNMADHPLLRASLASVALARSRVALVDANRSSPPELALRWSAQRAEAGSPSAQAWGLKLTLPWPAPAQARQEGAGARAELAQAEAELAQARGQLALALQKAQREQAHASQQLAWAQARCALSADTLQLTQRAFELGEADLPALLRARAAAHEARALLHRQQIAAWAAQSQHLQALGALP